MFTKLHSQKGFTLIEVLIVIAIMATGYAAFALMGFGTQNLLRDESTNMIQRIRYVYQLASTESQYFRIVFDMEENQYSVESSEDPVFVKLETDEKKEQSEDDEDKENLEEESDFAEAEDDQLEIFKIDDDIKIYSVYVDHQKDKISVGKAYLNFFPRGQTQFAVIQLSDLDEKQFMTLQVNPVTGNITVYDDLKDHDVILEEIKE